MSSWFIYSDQFFDKLCRQPLHLLSIIPSSIICCYAVKMLCSTLYKVSCVYFKAYASMKLCENMLSDDDETIDISLVKIEAWFDLRRYILESILPLFYEITNPIISLLVVSVIGFTFAWIYQLLAIFHGSPTKFFNSILADNTRFIAFGFTILLSTATMLILRWVLKPFREQQTHIDMIEIRKTWLLFDQQQCEIDMIRESGNQALVLKKKKLDTNIVICDHLIENMKQFTSAPSIFGIELNEAKLLAIRGYIVGVIAVFVGTLWSDYVTTYDELFQ